MRDRPPSAGLAVRGVRPAAQAPVERGAGARRERWRQPVAQAPEAESPFPFAASVTTAGPSERAMQAHLARAAKAPRAVGSARGRGALPVARRSSRPLSPRPATAGALAEIPTTRRGERTATTRTRARSSEWSRHRHGVAARRANGSSGLRFPACETRGPFACRCRDGDPSRAATAACRRGKEPRDVDSDGLAYRSIGIAHWTPEAPTGSIAYRPVCGCRGKDKGEVR